MFQARVLEDSVSQTGYRLTTFVVTFPRFILAEFNTHRMLSRNAASSRAIPITKYIEAVENDPFVPEDFGTIRPGMVAGEALQGDAALFARANWMTAHAAAIKYAGNLAELGVHKQLVNRLLEPFAWATVVVSATDWRNFFHLRTAPDAQPEFRKIAVMMLEAYEESLPRQLKPMQWHLPFITMEERDVFSALTAAHISAARCARVSYRTHDGKRNTARDIELADKLMLNGHMSPFEHPAVCQHEASAMGNFTGFIQLRKLKDFEDDPKGPR